MRRILAAAVLAVLVSGGGAAQDQSLVRAGTTFVPQGVILVRKQVMQTFGQNLPALNAAVRSRDLETAQDIARNIAALAALLPLLRADVHPDGYAGLTTQFRFKGGDPVVLLTRAKALQAAASAAAAATRVSHDQHRGL